MYILLRDIVVIAGLSLTGKFSALQCESVKNLQKISNSNIQTKYSHSTPDKTDLYCVTWTEVHGSQNQRDLFQFDTEKGF